MRTESNLVAVVGEPSSGKSYAMKYLEDPMSVANFDCDLKPNPHRVKYLANIKVASPKEVFEVLQMCIDNPDVKTIVIDTITYLMRTYKTLYVDNAEDTRASWGEYLKYYNKVMLMLKEASTHKNIIVLAHVSEHFDEVREHNISSMVLQGQAAKSPIGDFCTVVECKSIVITKRFLKSAEGNANLNFTKDELEDGIKYYFVTRKTKTNPATLARSASDLWEREELYVDNSIQILIDKLDKYYS
jgi:hypothetical protein